MGKRKPAETLSRVERVRQDFVNGLMDKAEPADCKALTFVMAEEIETLRSELKDAAQALNDEERHGDEWEQRAKIYIEAMEHSDPKLWVSDWHPEAAEWFQGA